MKILINCGSTFKGGSLQVARSIIFEATRETGNTYIIAHSSNLSTFISTLNPTPNVTFCQLEQRPSQRIKRCQDPGSELRNIENAYCPDIVFTTSGPSYWKPKAPHLMGFNLGHYIYPDSPFFKRISHFQRLKWKLRGLAVKSLYKRDAAFYAVQTNDANKRLRKWLGTSNVFTVSNTLSDIFIETKETPETAPTRHDSEFKVLVLSAYYPHKNLEIVNDLAGLAQKQKLSDVRFILTLPSEEYEKVVKPQNRPFVKNAGPLKPEDCPSHYRNSDAVFLPTLLECFSVTFLEAMAMKRPILSARLGFAESICGTAAVYYDPTNPKDAFCKLLTLKNDKQLQSNLVSAGTTQLALFPSPTERFQQYLNLLKAINNRQI
jgi:glycosyltransferase involved in cell wall biosynthesis